MKKTSMSVLLAVATLAAAGITSWGQANEPTLRYKWTAPTTGAPVEHYVGVVESWEDNGDTIRFEFVAPDTTTSFTYAWGYSVRVRVAGVDSQARQGPWSPWSVVWQDHGAPGAPSIPMATLEMVEK